MAFSSNSLAPLPDAFAPSLAQLKLSSCPLLVLKESVDDRISFLSSMTVNESLHLDTLLLPSQREPGGRYQIWNSGENSRPTKRIANLCVQRRQKVPLPTHADRTGKPKPLSEFLCQPAGMESMLNTDSLQHYESMGSNVFRCTLPKLEILNFEVAPVVDLSVVTDDQECIVEMLSCKFQGSEAVESQNERFSASMRNQLTWDTSFESDTLEVNVELNVSLEVYTLPFTLLPLSAVETPGNVILQAMVDRLVPLFLDHLLDDYYRWAQGDLSDAKSTTAGEPQQQETAEAQVLGGTPTYIDNV